MKDCYETEEIGRRDKSLVIFDYRGSFSECFKYVLSCAGPLILMSLSRERSAIQLRIEGNTPTFSYIKQNGNEI